LSTQVSFSLKSVSQLIDLFNWGTLLQNTSETQLASTAHISISSERRGAGDR
jgi:hypothetical protein